MEQNEAGQKFNTLSEHFSSGIKMCLATIQLSPIVSYVSFISHVPDGELAFCWRTKSTGRIKDHPDTVGVDMDAVKKIF